MADLLIKIQGIEEAVKDVQTLVRQYISSRSSGTGGTGGTERKTKTGQPDWATRIDGIISRLAQELQEVKQKIETGPIVTRDFVMAHPDPSLEARTTTPDRPSDGRPQRGGNSPNIVEEPQHGDPIATPLSEPETGENLASANPEPNNAAQSTPEIPRVPNISIPFRMEDGVVVLMPLNMDQCRDAPFLLSQAEALGARKTGVFKYVLPDDFELSARIVPSVTTRVSRFKSRRRADRTFQLSRSDKLETLNIGEGGFSSTLPSELAEKLEACLADTEAMNKMRYCTDIPAWGAEDRRQLGLPVESAIWPLKDNLLDRTNRIVDGLHRPYGYLAGEGGSLFATHEEDAGLMSFNALYAGTARPWCAVAPTSGHLVENKVRGGKCAQKVRHASLWIPRSELEAMGASFVTIVQRVREVIVLWGDTYHQGGAVGPALAEAVNYGGPGWSIENYAECDSTCPGFPIANKLLEFRGPNELQREQDGEDVVEARDSPQPKERQHPDRHASSMVTLTDRSLRKRRDRSPMGRTSTRKRPRTMRIPATITAEGNVSSATISQMAVAISSRAAIRQFFEIVAGRRDLEPTSLRTCAKDLSETCDPTHMLKAHIQTLNMFSRKTAFYDFLTRLGQARLAQHVEDKKHGQGKQPGERMRRGGLKKILLGTGMKERQYFHHRERGVKWREYDRMFPGILSFLLFHTQPFRFSSTDWVLLKDADFDCLRRHLKVEHVSALCGAGKKFEDSVDLTADDVEFFGESCDTSLEKASEEDLVAYLKPVPTTDEIIYDKDAYPDWPRPKGWPSHWDWADPTYIPPDETQCWECDQSRCDCVSRRPAVQPRIRKSQRKGRGLQAVARQANGVAYAKGTRLGWFTGKLAPPNTYRNGRCCEMFREDLEGEPEVAQINCSEISNIFGLMNHDCEPNVKLKGTRVSGKYRMAIIAKKDIRDGDEILFDYGSTYWEGECPCPKCRAKATATPA